MIGAVIGSINSFRTHTTADLTEIDGQRGSGGTSSACRSTDDCRNSVVQVSSGKSSSKSKEHSSTSRNSSKSSFRESSSDKKEEVRTQEQSSTRETYIPPTSLGSNDDWKREEEESKRVEEERRRIEEEERHNAEERFKQDEENRKHAEEEWKRVEEEKQRISEEAINRLRQEEALRQQKIEEARVNAQQSPDGSQLLLGCTDAKGLWTTDRSECSYQEIVHPDPVYVDPQVEAAQQEEIRRKMMDRYVAEEQSSQKQFLIVSLIGETLERLVAVRDANLLSLPEQQKFLDESIQWLRGGQEYFAAAGRSEDEVAQMSGYIRQIVGYAQQVTDEARKARISATGSVPEIGAIFERTEKMLNIVPDVLAILSTEGIEINQDVINAFGAIATRFAEIRSACMLDARVCGQLSEVLTGLEQLQAYVHSAIDAAGKPDVEQLVEEVVKARLQQ
jgi:hypothetical protein